ncbi:MAG: hypothetical protein COC06_01530 [Bacteroidales bacterium]|nr:MAG: hypothetical protein COC06_01530 [Bacteroidales bacterium]
MKTFRKLTFFVLLVFLSIFNFIGCQPKEQLANHHRNFKPGEIWGDSDSVHINSHGGGILFYNNTYYWFGEHKSSTTSQALVGVRCYSSADLYNWKNEGVVLAVSDNKTSPITKGCAIERPKVIYNKQTKQFVMYFHLELKDRGYEAAQVGIAVSDNITGPYTFLKSSRVNAGYWPANMTKEQRNSKLKASDYDEWWTPEWREAINDGLFVRRDFKGGQMSRDMTLFVDDDNKAYHIYSSEDNLTIQIAELSDDYLSYTGKYSRVEPGGHNEAPAILKKEGRYFMITSGCTGWAPNAARLLVADDIMGEWKLYPNLCKGKDAELTFYSQSTYILPVNGKKDAFIFMADRWTPRNPIDGRYVWLPILFENGLPVLKWMDEWTLDIFDQTLSDQGKPKEIAGYDLVWNDEFNYTGQADSEAWSHEKGFVRNEELQWYQANNTLCKNGTLMIYGKKEMVKNPDYIAGSNDWKKNREYARYTASSIKTEDKKEFQYGRFEIRAKIPVASGAWPAIWTLGSSMEWPSCGEIDLMEYYQIDNIPHILANAAWGSDKKFDAKWNSSKIPFSEFLEKDSLWINKFHIWRMDWDEEAIRLYLDDELLNETFLSDTNNGLPGESKNPFKQAHYILLNLAIGGNGGTPDDFAFPLQYEVDYVRVYQKK